MRWFIVLLLLGLSLGLARATQAEEATPAPATTTTVVSLPVYYEVYAAPLGPVIPVPQRPAWRVTPALRARPTEVWVRQPQGWIKYRVRPRLFPVAVPEL